jgi:ribosome recycling factor
MKVFSAVILLVVSSNVCDAFAPSLPAFTRAISSSTVANTPINFNNNSMKSMPTSLRMAFESPEEVEMDVEERMGKSIESVKQNLVTIRTGRASAAILDLVKVDYYGAPTPLNQMASISVPNSQQLAVSPYDKGTLADIERAIVESNLGLTPNNDGDLIRINIPQITEERRKDLLKQCKAMGEDGKVAIRNVRRDGVEAVKKMEKAGDIGEDESNITQDSIQKLTDQFVKEIDGVVAKKEKEVMTV